MKIITMDSSDPNNLYESLSEKGRRDLFAKLIQYEEPTQYVEEEERHIEVGGMMVAIGIIILIGLCL